jgi:hypothetical protein
MNTITAIMPECDNLRISYYRGKYHVSIHQYEGEPFVANVWTNPPRQRSLWNKHVVTFSASDLQRLLDTLIAWEMDSIPARKAAS